MKNLFVISILILSTTLYADWDNEQQLAASDGSAYDYFGNSISIDGDYAVIGAWKDGANSTMTGSAYVFYKNGTNWIEQEKITASDGEIEDFFGYSVCISGDYAIIGAYGDDDNGSNSGSAYIFYRNGNSWTEQIKLTPLDGASEDRFGCEVSISGDYAIVGAWGDDVAGVDRGSAYIFYRSGTNWNEQAKLTALDGMDEDLFGYSVSISGDYAVIGSYYDDDNGSESGSAYIFYRSGTNWTEQTKLTAPDGAAYDWFGYAVSINGDYAAIGAHWDDDNGSNSGSAYIFNRTGTLWTLQTKITADDGSVDDEFGRSISIDGDNVVVGACHDDDTGIDRGSAYIFNKSETNWIQQEKITASNGADFDYFGCPVSISGNYVLISAHYHDYNGIDSGSAYVYFSGGVFIEEQVNITVNAKLYDNYPNPFTTSTTIEYELNKPETVSITFYNQLGKQVDAIEESQQKGLNNVVWTSGILPDGIYYFKLQTGEQVASGKVVLVR